ncbi:P-loop containing nucleoside triphosphate hydrolase protein [Trichoderma ceciliae]
MAVRADSPPPPGLESRLLALEKQLVELDEKYQSLLTSTSRSGDEPEGKSHDLAESEKPDASKAEIKPNDGIEEPSPNSRVKIIRAMKDPETGERVERPDELQNSKLKDNNNLAFILKKFSDEGDSSEIDIINPNLWELLKEHLGSYPDHIFRGSPVTLCSPFEFIVFEWDTLKAAAEQAPQDDADKEAREDLKLLLNIISGGSSGDAKLDKYFKVRDLRLRDMAVQFDDLWTIFPPGTLVYGKPFQNQDQVFVVRDYMKAWPGRGDRPQRLFPWKLDCWTYDWTGKKFQRAPFELSFEPFEGHRPITALPYYPFELVDDGLIKEALIARGQTFRQLCTAKDGSRLFEYEGDAVFGKKGFTGVVQGEDDDSDMRLGSFLLDIMRAKNNRSAMSPEVVKSSYINSRVMVDYLSYFQYGPTTARNGVLEPSTGDMECMCSDCQENKGLAAKYRARFDTLGAQKKSWEDEQYILCPPRVLGYVLKDKQWAELQISFVREIPSNDSENAWKTRLQLADGDKTKDLLLDLVRSHVSSATGQTAESRDMALEVDDIIPGKGKGLVILLYGPPGVGKTSTAETISLATRKPLFSISVADVGTEARHVESNLSRIFSLATSWQAILLIDEADVFLESRGKGASASADRNALVSVFLRVLEYYQGIMFLTTNQIAQFDVAIPSRIHVSIRYQSLNASQMKGIFKGFIDPLNDKDLVDDYDDILEWLNDDVYSIGFDGRQIRNIVTASLGLARAEQKHKNGKGKLCKKHLKAIVYNARSFKSDFVVQYDRYITAQEKLIK